MRVEIFTSSRYGGWCLSWSKQFELPFAPFMGLDLTVGDDLSILLDNNQYTSCGISYDLVEQKFTVNQYVIWRHPVTDETVDDIISSFKKHFWKRWDNTDVEAMKSSMKSDYEKNKKP